MSQGQWKHDLFGCFSNINLALQTWIVPCVTYGQNTEGAELCSCVVGGLAYYVPGYNLFLKAKTREAIREKRGIPGTFGNDCLMSICCGYCTLIQENAEMFEQTSVNMARE
ncbi:PCR4-like protein [Mya arenaria]|uniref:PCR4-like protein n=1 Tax=Mya arenaria TaxID=6604 RepID=A0ABY7EIJ5_MYAAR|nr:uncharacterized protein LOC128239333 [Mya arenaria]WAR08631.1 PCR4-like protein [Mya arenaria]